jgi:hypothetical protein
MGVGTSGGQVRWKFVPAAQGDKRTPLPLGEWTVETALIGKVKVR